MNKNTTWKSVERLVVKEAVSSARNPLWDLVEVSDWRLVGESVWDLVEIPVRGSVLLPVWFSVREAVHE